MATYAGALSSTLSSPPSAVDGSITPAINETSNLGVVHKALGRMANEDRLSRDCSLIPTSYLAHAKELTVVPAREDRFPELVRSSL